MDLITLERIKLLHPTVRKEVLQAYKYVNNILLGKGVRLRFAYTWRSFKEQDELYAQGRTKPGKKITNARAGFSVHNYGLAFDIVLLVDKDGNGTFETASWDTMADFDRDHASDWMEVINYFKKLGWSWGGDWKSFKDSPHLEKTFGLTPNEMLHKYNADDDFTEVINGKTYTWINL